MESVIEAMKQRFSCRRCLDKNLDPEIRRHLAEFLENHSTGPFGSRTRFALIAAGEDDQKTLKGLGTYGFIKGAKGFFVGALGPGTKNLEDFGYLMEYAILFATSLGLGTCWLGGSFTKSSFAKRINTAKEETLPAVTSVGYIDEEGKSKDWIRRKAGGPQRLPSEQLFFEGSFGNPIDMRQTGAYAALLELVRWAPSASNKQPWRIIRSGGDWHFFLQRTKGYGKDSLLGKLIGVADLQRVDMGIAMCHFELAARELNLAGSWALREPDIKKPTDLTEYTVSWISDQQ
jgi:hypothetical protein